MAKTLGAAGSEGFWLEGLHSHIFICPSFRTSNKGFLKPMDYLESIMVNV